MPRFKLQFDPALIRALAGRYDYPGEAELIREVARPAKTNRYFTAEQFVRLVAWKTGGRAVPLFLANSPDELEAATRVALDPATPEPLRAGVLVALSGVGYPVASCVLHFAHRDPYPILDRRALQSLGYQTKRTVYSEAFWQDYIAECRRLAREHNVPMRTLDRALWRWPDERPHFVERR
jgi:hypothetical protein